GKRTILRGPRLRGHRHAAIPQQSGADHLLRLQRNPAQHHRQDPAAAGRVRQSLFGLVQDTQLMLTSTLTHAATYYGDVEVVSHAADGETRSTYRQVDERARRLASSLGRLGIAPGSFAGSLAFTTHRHLELFHAVPG